MTNYSYMYFLRRRKGEKKGVAENFPGLERKIDILIQKNSNTPKLAQLKKVLLCKIVS